MLKLIHTDSFLWQHILKQETPRNERKPPKTKHFTKPPTILKIQLKPWQKTFSKAP